MRGALLRDCLRDLRAECGHSTAPNVGMNAEDALLTALERTQLRLWEEWDWPHLLVNRYIELQAGQRFYSVPPDLPFERIQTIAARDGSRWKPLTYGITTEDYNLYDPDMNERSYPPRKYFVTEDPQDTQGNIDGRGMIEVWPLADRNANEQTKDGFLRLTGIRTMRRFSQLNDRCELDATLIVLYAAADILAREKSDDAQLKLQQAQQLNVKLKGNSTRIKTWRLGLPMDEAVLWPHHPTYVNRRS